MRAAVTIELRQRLRLPWTVVAWPQSIVSRSVAAVAVVKVRAA